MDSVTVPPEDVAEKKGVLQILIDVSKLPARDVRTVQRILASGRARIVVPKGWKHIIVRDEEQ